MTQIIKDGINYGHLVQVNLDGVTIVGERDYFSFYLFNKQPFDHVPYEDHYCQLVIQLETHMQPYFYARRQEDVLKVAKKLSEGHSVQICAMSRILARFDEGEQIGPLRSVEDFYVELSQEEIEAHRLIE